MSKQRPDEQETEGAQEANEQRQTTRPPSPEANQGWLKLYESLEAGEKIFVREALKDGDLDRAARQASYRNTFELLGRTKVRRALLIAASFSDTKLAVKLAKPFVMERLIASAVEGETSAVKFFLSLEVPEKRKAPDYGKSVAQVHKTEEQEEPDLSGSPV